jgi:hypothetical protein
MQKGEAKWRSLLEAALSEQTSSRLQERFADSAAAMSAARKRPLNRAAGKIAQLLPYC